MIKPIRMAVSTVGTPAVFKAGRLAIHSAVYTCIAMSSKEVGCTATGSPTCTVSNKVIWKVIAQAINKTSYKAIVKAGGAVASTTSCRAFVTAFDATVGAACVKAVNATGYGALRPATGSGMPMAVMKTRCKAALLRVSQAALQACVRYSHVRDDSGSSEDSTGRQPEGRRR
jgi:hypothetical protein